jgi:phosphoribosyl 1,2-cyclic phosphodiesterase
VVDNQCAEKAKGRMGFKVKFWGVRGSIACPSPDHVKYGGNTSCIQVVIDDTVIILDAGTGIRNLGEHMLKHKITDATLMLTHSHWDHINGFPFFTPAYSKDTTLHVMAGHLSGGVTIQDILSSQMANPVFPVPLTALQAKLKFTDFDAGDTIQLTDKITVRTALLNHPNGATGYRIEANGFAFAYITDTEHVPGQDDKNVLRLIDGADLVAYDSTYTEDEFPAKIGWGHSTWQEGMRLCQKANVKTYALFHHDPSHDDSFMEALEQEAKQAWDKCIVARDNMEIILD